MVYKDTGQAEIHKMILKRQAGLVADLEALKMKVWTRDEVHQNMKTVILCRHTQKIEPSSQDKPKGKQF